jgi:hypothetical protein
MVKRLESHARDSRQLRQPMKIHWTPRAAERTACCIKPKRLPMSIAKDVITAATQTYVVGPMGSYSFMQCVCESPHWHLKYCTLHLKPRLRQMMF